VGKKLILVAISLIVFSSQILAAKAEYAITPVKDNVYRFTAGNYHSVFMVTAEGIIVTDPIDPGAANYLQKELKKRFKQPVKYLLYSHNHVDHVLGGEVYADQGATVVAHEYAAEDIVWTKLPTAKPDVTFRDEFTVNLGGSSVHLQYHGPNNGRGSVSMRFMPANVMHVVDWIVVGRMPYQNLVGYDIHGMIRSTQEILAMEPFAVFVGGHADIGDRDDVQNYLGYLQSLYNGVRDAMLAGKSLPEIQSELQLPQYASLKMYEAWLPMNIEGVYNTFIDRSYFQFRKDIGADD